MLSRQPTSFLPRVDSLLIDFSSSEERRDGERERESPLVGRDEAVSS